MIILFKSERIWRSNKMRKLYEIKVHNCQNIRKNHSKILSFLPKIPSEIPFLKNKFKLLI